MMHDGGATATPSGRGRRRGSPLTPEEEMRRHAERESDRRAARRHAAGSAEPPTATPDGSGPAVSEPMAIEPAGDAPEADRGPDDADWITDPGVETTEWGSPGDDHIPEDDSAPRGPADTAESDAAPGRAADDPDRIEEEPPAAPATPGSAAPRVFRRELQGLRAVAILMVVCYHIWFDRVSGGVDIFLLISAFLLTDSFTRRLSEDTPLAVVRYWARAFKRLLPPAAVVIAATLGAIVLWYPPSRFPDLITQGLASLTFWENWHLAALGVDYYATDRSEASPFQHFWSLSIQGQVFVLWPLLLAAVALLRRVVRLPLRATLAALFALILGASLTWSVISTATAQAVAYFDTFTRLWEFALGSLLALLLPRVERNRESGGDRPAGLRAAAGWIGVLAILACGWVVDVEGAFPGWIALWPLLAACVVIAAGRTRTSWGVDRILASAPLRWVGDISYSLYLVHWPILVTTVLVLDVPRLDALQGTAVVAASVALGWLLTIAVDTPVHRWRWASARLWRSAVVIIAALAVGGAPLAALDRYGERAAPTAGSARYPGALSLLPGAGPVPDPSRGVPFVPYPDQLDEQWVWFDHPCTTDATVQCDQLRPAGTDHARTVVGYGNSHTQQFLGALAPLAERHDWQLTRPTLSGCDYRLDDGSAECRAWNARMREDLAADPPDAVVLQSTLLDAAGDGESAMPGYEDAATFLLGHGIDVIAVRDNPRFGWSQPECIFTEGPDSTLCRLPRAELFAAESPAPTVVSTTSARVVTVDLTDTYCPAGQCRPVIGNVLVYRDDNHVTADFARTLAPAVEAQLRAQGFEP